MAVITEEIYSLLVPLAKERLIVPRACVAEVIRYGALSNGEVSDDWLIGMARWNNQEIPVVSFELLCDLEPPPPSGRTRIVVFNRLGGAPDCPPYGILSEGFPQMVRVNREVVVPDESYRPPADVPIICRISMLKDQALIPDLELLEQRISATVAAA